MDRSKASHAMEGFTLVEVLVALVIVAVALGAGLRVSGSQIHSAQHEAMRLRAQLCAHNHLSALRMARQFPDTGSGALPCVQANHTLWVRTLVQPTPNPGFRRVDVSVHASGNDPSTLAQVSTVIGRF